MAELKAAGTELIHAKPILKWAGGKTQMLKNIMPKVPKKFNKYLEPFFGGGALYFALSHERAVIADKNQELINIYRQVAENVDVVIECLQKYENTEEEFYAVRSIDWTNVPKAEAAARMIYLNRSCFNGLYRVNRKGQFNVPYGHYKDPKFCNEDALRAASIALSNAVIICGDYIEVLNEYAQEGDFVFLGPSYLPVSQIADFNKYTRERFYEEDHVVLSKEVERLHEMGCYVILTNSNVPLVHELYVEYQIDVIQMKRYISRNGNNRAGEDVIVTAMSENSEFSNCCLKLAGNG